MNVSGKGVVVTGAGHGVGRAIASRMAAEGARVVVNDLDVAAARRVAAMIQGHAVPGDAASEPGVAALVELARQSLGEIDVWFANAGIEPERGTGTSERAWASALECNLLAHVRAARLLVPGWLERGQGRFVITASAAGLLTRLGGPAYPVTSHAAVAFGEWLSATYRHRGIVVQVICPPEAGTGMYQSVRPLPGKHAHDGVVRPADVAARAAEAIEDDRFLVLPHPAVAGHYAHRATAPDRWLRAVNKVQQELEQAGTPRADRYPSAET